MRILMTATNDHQSRVTRLLLEARGHEVATCGDSTSRAVACASLRGEICPLDEGAVDVAVHPSSARPPEIVSAGLLCALRHFVPLVVASVDPEATADPFTSWANAVCEPEHLEEAIQRAASQPLFAHGEAAERGANGVLTAAGREPSWHAVVHRIGPRLRVELRSDEPVPEELRNASSVRAAALVRELDHLTPLLDVVVTAPHDRLPAR